MLKIAPSILSADFSNLERAVAEVEQGGADYLHIDIMDGHFVPNITLGPMVVKSLRSRSRLFFDVHLMISEPDRYIEQFIIAGADLVTVHVEACPHLHRTLQHIKEKGAKAGVALNPATPLAMVENVLEDVDLVLVMTVNPGFGGQAFLENMLPKIRRLRQMFDTLPQQPELEVDGGISDATAARAVASGADVLVAGSYIFAAANPADAIARLRKAVGGR